MTRRLALLTAAGLTSLLAAAGTASATTPDAYVCAHTGALAAQAYSVVADLVPDQVPDETITVRDFRVCVG